ncbi:MAG: hypothetical protein P8Z49_00685 [Acidobacteriota bacterium]|jgi:hypothetical protein
MFNRSHPFISSYIRVFILTLLIAPLTGIASLNVRAGEPIDYRAVMKRGIVTGMPRAEAEKVLAKYEFAYFYNKGMNTVIGRRKVGMRGTDVEWLMVAVDLDKDMHVKRLLFARLFQTH